MLFKNKKPTLHQIKKKETNFHTLAMEYGLMTPKHT